MDSDGLSDDVSDCGSSNGSDNWGYSSRCGSAKWDDSYYIVFATDDFCPYERFKYKCLGVFTSQMEAECTAMDLPGHTFYMSAFELNVARSSNPFTGCTIRRTAPAASPAPAKSTMVVHGPSGECSLQPCE